MSSPEKNIMYLNYDHYNYFDGYFKTYRLGDTDRDHFSKTIGSMEKITNNNNLLEQILLELTRHLNGTSAFYYHHESRPCNYINYWLNKKIRTSEHRDIYKSNFNLFKKYTDVRHRIYRKENRPSCNEYIHELNEETFNQMDILYDLYNEYATLTLNKKYSQTKECSKLGILAKNYAEIIDKCYEKQDLFKNLINIKDLIVKLISQPPSPCKQMVYFIESQKLLEEKLKKEAAQKAEELKLEQERRAAELKKEEEQRALEAEEKMKQMLKTPEVHQDSFNQGAPLYTVDPENLRASSDLEVKGPDEVLDYSVGLYPSRRLENLNEHVSPQNSEYQLGEQVHKPGNEHTNTDGSFLGSMRLPGVITDVLGSVDPAPVLGVSGGMGVLFILFKVFKVLKL
ncbi:hypothetical protein PVIIG_06284 [Plasmodium vivax India VII]|uniref:VIR protein n=1 Tax=Plasmodium vivax India VII TaxID=1077284 RepID=A0A0J9SGD8_PLAVI|nr:hypothetical protein PVIIG_06284 [Plasmodium vivax India VII]